MERAGVCRWCEGRELRPVYREFRQLVQTLCWRRGEPPDRTVLLKAPQFMQDLHAVLEAFPGARILWMKRDVDTVVASSASLVWNQQRVQSDRADPVRVGREWQRKTDLRQERAQLTLAQRQPSTLVLPVDYAAMNADWRGQVRRIYDVLGMALPDTGRCEWRASQAHPTMSAIVTIQSSSGFRAHELQTVRNLRLIGLAS